MTQVVVTIRQCGQHGIDCKVHDGVSWFATPDEKRGQQFVKDFALNCLRNYVKEVTAMEGKRV
jgi:hypothetical protein